LKKIYTSATVAIAEDNLEAFAVKWDSKYPTISKQWRAKWADIISMFEFPEEIRRVTYTTNAIESLNSTIRKFTKNRKQYPSESSALKLIFMAIREASRRWTRPIKHWKQALNHFAILFPDRIPKDHQP
jgi:transposase-like protein